MGLVIISPAGPPSRRGPFCVICPRQYLGSHLYVEGHLLAFCICCSPSLDSLSCSVSHDPLGRTGWKRKEMSLSQRLVLILAAPFCGSLSLKTPSWECGTSSVGWCLPTASNKQPEPASLAHCVPPALERCWRSKCVAEWVKLGEQRTRLGVCSEERQEMTRRSCCSVLGA